LEGIAAGLFVAICGYLMAGLFLTLAFERYFWLLAALGGAAIIVLNRADPDTPGTVTPPHGGAGRRAAEPSDSQVVPLPVKRRPAPALQPARSSAEGSRRA